MEEVKDMYFEELEKVQELDAVSDFVNAAEPWVFGSITIAIALT